MGSDHARETDHAAKPVIAGAPDDAHAGHDAKRSDTEYHQSAGTGADDAPAKEVTDDGGLFSLTFGVGKSLRYQAKRRAFFEALHRGALALSAISASAAFTAIVGNEGDIAKWLALGIAVVAGLDAVIGFAERARVHDDLYRRFADLAAMIAEPENPTREQVRRWHVERLKIEKDEPTPLGALNVRCHNEEAEARGFGDDVKCRVMWHQVLFSQFFTLPPFGFPPISKKLPTDD